jgi:pSer/pThr/pTyr-binding forkhead associated (FHA) protein
MEVRLVVDAGGSRKRAVRLKSEETIIGRRHDCDLRIKSSEVSRRHCLLSIQEGYLSVEDLDSVNGTYLNGKRISGRQIVRPGDFLEIGPVRFVVEYELTQATLDLIDNSQSAGEEVEALPLAEDEEQAAFAFDEGELEVLPAADDRDTEQILPPADNDDEPLPVLEDLDEGGDWHLPPAGDLRDLLSDMDDPKNKKRAHDE